MFKKTTLLLIPLVILFGLSIKYWFLKPKVIAPVINIATNKVNEHSGNNQNILSINNLQNEYGDFAKLTIPYLQQIELGKTQINIEQTLNSYASYTSYLASYTSEELKVYGLLTVPNQQPPSEGFKSIIFLHGYIPPNQYVTTQRYEAYVNYLANRGFVVFKIDYRGHGNSQGEPSGAYFSSDYIVDTMYAAKALKSLNYVNPNKIGVWGHSMSGNVALRTLASSKTINTIVIWAGAVYTYEDFYKYKISDNSFVRQNPIPGQILSRSQRLFNAVGQYTSTSEFWQLVVPTNFLSENNKNIQINHAVNDDVVSINYAYNLQSIMQNKQNINFELIEYKGGGHNINSPYFEQAMENTVNFFNNNL